MTEEIAPRGVTSDTTVAHDGSRIASADGGSRIAPAVGGGAADPLVAFRIRAVRSGIAASFLVVVPLVAYALLPGHGAIHRTAILLIMAVALAAAVGVALLPWDRIAPKTSGQVVIHVWIILDVALIDVCVALTGGAQSPLVLVLLVMTAFVASPAYSRVSQGAFVAIIVLGYLLTLALLGWHIGTAVIVLRVGMLLAAATVTGIFSNELGVALQRQAHHRESSEQRAALWRKVADLGRTLRAFDSPLVLSGVVDALTELGFETADICVMEEDRSSYRVVHSRGLPASYTEIRHPTTSGVVAQVNQSLGTVVVPDYVTSDAAVTELLDAGIQKVIATPIWVGGELTAVLEAGITSRRPLFNEEVAAFELLAAHAGHALEATRHLERQQEDADRFRSLLTSSPDAVVVVDANGTIVEVSNHVELLFQWTADELVGQPVWMLVPERLHHFLFLEMGQDAQQSPRKVLANAQRQTELFGIRKDGSEFPVEANLETLRTPQGLVVSAAIRDVTERREFEHQLAHQATHDHVTGLPNRVLFLRRLTEALSEEHEPDPELAVCFLDLDHFKYVNDSRGHGAGDLLVTAVAQRMAEVAGSHLVARFGGDEFTVLLRGYEDRNAAVEFAQHLLASFETPFAVRGVDAFVTASLGIAFAGTGDDPELIMRNADAAMYEAKRNGRARMEQFDTTLTLRAAERVSTESDLHLGLARDEFQLVYQPVVCMEDGRLTGMEALIRWHHPAQGIVSPVRFIPLAEETGLIVPIGQWVLGEALRQMSEWRARHPDIPDFSMSVNVSGRQLEHDQFVNQTGQLLQATGVPPHLLTLEITESLFIHDIAGAIRRLDALKRLGLRLAIDDFGTGFSSLAALSKLPVNTVKVDKSFIDSLGGDHDAVVSAIVQLADAYGLDVIAEGIERLDQRDRLIELGYQYAQGYFFHRPLTLPDANQLLRSLDPANG